MLFKQKLPCFVENMCSSRHIQKARPKFILLRDKYYRIKCKLIDSCTMRIHFSVLSCIRTSMYR